jgi:hypothetical protein
VWLCAELESDPRRSVPWLASVKVILQRTYADAPRRLHAIGYRCHGHLASLESVTDARQKRYLVQHAKHPHIVSAYLGVDETQHMDYAKVVLLRLCWRGKRETLSAIFSRGICHGPRNIYRVTSIIRPPMSSSQSDRNREGPDKRVRAIPATFWPNS